MQRSQIILNFFVYLLLFSPAVCGSEPLRGEPFSAPDYVQQVPPGWEEKPIKHDPDFGDIDLAVTLDQHLYQFLPAAIREYARARKLKIAVSEGNCGITAAKLIRKTADVGGYCCPPGRTDRLPGLRFHTMGIIPIQILVHPDNPLENITLQQARDIFQGRIYRWSEIQDAGSSPGQDRVIQTIGRLHCKIRPGHWRLLLDNEDLFGPRLQEVGTIPDMISLVANSPDAIGYEVGMMADLYQPLEGKVKSLAIDGWKPTPDNLLAGRYPFYRTLNLTTWAGEYAANPEADKLVDFLLKLGPSLVEQYGLVPAHSLRQAGWQFKGNELVGEPGEKAPEEK